MATNIKHPRTAFVRIHPLDIVFDFDHAGDATNFWNSLQKAKQEAHLNAVKTWVSLPFPPGLLRVYTASKGDVGFEFGNHECAQKWAHHLAGVGKTNVKDKPDIVYVGRHIC